MSHPIFDLTDRVALVTGAAAGMGRAMAIGFAESGADLMLADINEPGAQETAHEIESLGRRAIPVRCDVSDVDQVRGMFSLLDVEFGRIDVLGNVAGGTMLGKPEDLTLDQLQESMQSLVIARFCSCQEGGRRMLAAGKGSIINIGSLASLTAIGRGHVAYSIGMGAVAQMTRELSTEWSSRGVRVNAILPAQVMNPFLEKTPEGRTPHGRYLAGRHSVRPVRRAARYRGRRHLPGIRRVGLGHRRDVAHGRRKPRDERRRHLSRRPDRQRITSVAPTKQAR